MATKVGQAEVKYYVLPSSYDFQDLERDFTISFEMKMSNYTLLFRTEKPA